MDTAQNQLDKLIYSLEESKSYLSKKANLNFGYRHLIKKIDSRIDRINTSKPVIKLVSTSCNLVSKLKQKSESSAELKPIYDFEAIAPFKNILKIAENCTAIVAIFNSSQIVTQHQRKLIDLARKKEISLFILVVDRESNHKSQTLDEYLRSQLNLSHKSFSLPVNSFFDPNSDSNFKDYQQFLIQQKVILKEKFIRDNRKNAIEEIELFFNRQNAITREKINQVKQDYLQGKEVHYYHQQILNKTFNQIKQRKQQKLVLLKQKINQSRSVYLNPFKSNSWLFELQEIIESSQVKIVQEKANAYVYATVKNGNRTEYIHNYILNLYQQRVVDFLESQWSNINYVYGNGGFKDLIVEINQTIGDISLLEYSAIQISTITFDLEPFPKLNISEIIEPYCLQTNSKLIFDYNYTQSTWFKLSISLAIGISIYLITKLYFGEGKYIGFFILFFQIINIFTGQSAKQIKLKSHEKELRRTLNNKYQIFARLVVEQMIQTLIADLDRKSEQCQTQIDAIAELAFKQLSKIERDLKQYQSKIKQLDRDRIKLTAWLN